MSKPQECIVLRFNHFDPTWRRCWDRRFADAGRIFASYRDIEERWITDAIATCADGTGCFMVECSWVLRHYLERHPEQIDTLRKLTQEGRFELLGSGENIVDANMIHGELLARNLVLGTLWAEDTLGVRPGTGWHSDGFGSCAQMPQIFRQCGYEWLPAISYNIPDAPYWRGLDGSTIFFSSDAPHALPPGAKRRLVHRQAFAGCNYVKFPPCPECLGKGCGECRGEGFTITERAEFTAPPKERLPGETGVLVLWGEEIMPGLNVSKDIAKFNSSHPEFAVRQGTYCDIRKHLSDYLGRVDDPPSDQISSKVENNPGQSGCYVSRIKIKQQHRVLEHSLLMAECWDTLFNGGASSESLRGAWKKMTFSAFHDAITSSHCDPAYTELCDLHGELGVLVSEITAAACGKKLSGQSSSVTVFNHTQQSASAPVKIVLPVNWKGASVSVGGKPVPVHDVSNNGGATEISFLASDVPALGACTFNVKEAAPMTAEKLVVREVSCGQFTVSAGEHGLTGIRSDSFGEVVDTRNFHFGELVLESDVGDPWATRSLDRTRTRLSPHTKLVDIVRNPHQLTIRYSGKHPSCDDPHRTDDPNVTYLTWEQAFHLRSGVPWLEIETRVKWYTQSRRLRLAFPSTTALNRGVYEVPYGVMERDRYEGKSINGGNAGGDWPAIHWAGIQTPDCTFAIFNQGTPSYRIEDGVVMVSVLRSPQIPYGLFEPQFYVAYNYDGMRDHGDHVFRHALYLGAGDWRENDTVREAVLFNSGLTACPGSLAGPLPDWCLDSKHIRMTAVKKAERGDGIVMRFAESAGKKDVLRLTPPAGFSRAEICNLLEEPLESIRAENGTFSIPLAPWKIITVKLR
ncbi:MAG: glycosyl hydrolase-related protein [Victivallales bacterium]